MRTRSFLLAFLLAMAFVSQSCEIAGGIFKAGAATGIIAVILAVALIIFLISRSGKK